MDVVLPCISCTLEAFRGIPIWSFTDREEDGVTWATIEVYIEEFTYW